MDIIVVSVAAFLVSILTFFSGFGLGTLLTPVFMIYFPVELAIALTGVVHFCTNVFRMLLTAKTANTSVVLRFGGPAVIAALLGSWILLHISNVEPIFSYQAFAKTIPVYPLKFVIAILLAAFAAFDLIPYFGRLQFDRTKLVFGGILSGFFGGLSGIQGPIRSAFLIKSGLSKESYIATTVVISTMVDFTRLGMYSTRFTKAGLNENLTLVLCATLSAILGSFIGNIVLTKVTLHNLQIGVAIMLITLSLSLGFGLL